jgi:L-fuculose-phosphate aldolase
LAARVSPQHPIAVLEYDGVLVTGASVLDPFDRLEVMESTAEAVINARVLGDVTPMSEHDIRELCDALLRK